MAGKLRIEMEYDSSVILGAEMWGNLRFIYKEYDQEEVIYYTTTAIDRFIRWYLSASPHIFAKPPIPFIEGKNYSETVLLYLEEFDKSLAVVKDLTERKEMYEANEIYSQYLKMSQFNRLGDGLGDPAEPIINIVRRGKYGEVSFAEKDNSPYIRDTEYVKRWIKPGPWAYFFELENFVSETKATIFRFIDDVQRNYVNEKSKLYADKFAILALGLNHYPELDSYK